MWNSSRASGLLALSAQQTISVGMDEAGVRGGLLTFQHHHRLGTRSILPLRAAAGRGLVPLEQLVHLPLDVRGAPVAVALGDGEPLAHGCRR